MMLETCSSNVEEYDCARQLTRHTKKSALVCPLHPDFPAIKASCRFRPVRGGRKKKLGFKVCLCRLQSLTVHCVHIRVNG